MSVYRLCRARGWTRQEPGRVDRMVRRLGPRLCRLHTSPLYEALVEWCAKQEQRSPSFPPISLGRLEEAVASWSPLPAAPSGVEVSEDGDKFTYTLRGSFAGASPRGWRDVRLTFAGVDVTPHFMAVNRKPLRPPWPDPSPTAPANESVLRYLRATWALRSYPDRPWAVVYPQGPAIGERFRIGWPPWLGYAWPPAGDERRPPQWQGGDHNKNNDNKNGSKTMGNLAKTVKGEAGGLMATTSNPPPDRLPERLSPEESAALTAEGIVSRQERDAAVLVDAAARKLLTAIVAAEAAGLTVLVEQRKDSVHAYGDFFPQIRTVDIAVGVTKRLR